MKTKMTFKLIMAILFILITSPSSAQFVTTPTNSKGKINSILLNNTNNYRRFSFSISLITPRVEHQYETIIQNGEELKIGSYSMDDVSLGASFGYIFGINIGGPNIPLFLEVGPEINYSRSVPHDVKLKDEYTTPYEEWKKDRRDTHSAFRTHLLNISSPVNLAYRFILGEKVSIAPSAGLNAIFHILAHNFYYASDDETISYFDSKNFDPTANRFQLGWNVGVGAYFGNFYLGYKFNSGFSPFISAKESFYDELKMSFDQHSVSFGYIIQ